MDTKNYLVSDTVDPNSYFAHMLCAARRKPVAGRSQGAKFVSLVLQSHAPQGTRTCHLTTWHWHTRKDVLWIPLDSYVENNTSAKRKRSTPTVMKFSSGST